VRNACNVNIAGQVRREIPVNQLVSQSIYLSTANERATYESGQGTLLTGNRRRKTTCSRCPRNNTSSKQSNRRLTSPALCTPVTPFPPTGDATYRQRARGGPSHGHRQPAQIFSKDRAYGDGIYPRGQTVTQTGILITILRIRSRGRSNYY